MMSMRVSLSPTPTPSASQGATPDFWTDLGKWVHDLFNNDATPTVIAFLALALSVLALWNQFSRGRKADLSVRFAKTADYKYSADLLVITNHGAASAKNITLALTVDLEAKPAVYHEGILEEPEEKGGEQPWKPYREDVDPFPIQILAPGASFYLPVDVYGNGVGEAPSALAKLIWKDRRLRHQSWTSTVSSTGQPLGGPSIERYDAERQARMMSYLL